MKRPDLGRLVILAIAGVVTMSACAPPPATGPELATEVPGPEADTATEPDDGAAPPWEFPAQPGNWGACPTTGFPQFPEVDVELECSVLESPVAPQISAVVDVPLVSVSTPETPQDAPPLMVVAGPEQPIEDELARLATTATELVDAHPLVGVSHRGQGEIPDTCLSRESLSALASVADYDVDPVGPETQGTMADVATDCLDALVGTELEFGADGAARDLATIRDHWQVPGLAVLAVGEGSRTALRYASENPGGTSLLVLDSPVPPGGSEENLRRAAVDGSEAALRAWAGTCTRPECGTGTAQEKVDTLTEHIEAAARGEAAVPAAVLADTIRDALGDLAGASDPEAAAGDQLLGELVDAPAGDIPPTIADAALSDRGSSLPFVAGCTDLTERVPTSRIPELVANFEQVSPTFGRVLANQILECSAWSTTSAEPLELDAELPLLLLTSSADPSSGSAPSEQLAGALTASGIDEVTTVTWRAPGAGLVGSSDCVQGHLADFLEDPSGAEPGVCPS